MKGSIKLPFSLLFTDTLNTHGLAWCIWHYCIKGKMPRKEFLLWVRIAMHSNARAAA